MQAGCRRGGLLHFMAKNSIEGDRWRGADFGFLRRRPGENDALMSDFGFEVGVFYCGDEVIDEAIRVQFLDEDLDSTLIIGFWNSQNTESTT